MPPAGRDAPPAAHRLAAVASDVFVAEGSVRFYGFRIPTRMAVLRLSGARLLLYSPLLPDRALREELTALGSVHFVVSPNKIHNQTLAAVRAAFPEACLLAPPGLRERCPELRCDAVLGDAAVPGWEGEVEHRLTAGNVFFREAVLFHRPSRTLLVGDLVENFGPGDLSAPAQALASLFGVRHGPGPSPEFRLYTEDAAAAERALARIREWPFERIFLCHGRLVERDAAATFAGVARALLDAARARSAASRWLLRRLARWQ